MANSNKNIEQVFKQGFNNFEHNVSSKVWNNLDAELFQTKMVDTSYSIGKSLLVSLIPFSILVGTTFLSVDEEVTHQIVQENVVPEDSKHELITTNDGEIEEERVINENPIENNQPVQEIVFEDDNGEFVEQVVVADDTELANEEKEVYQPKEMPKLSDKPYLNYSYFKERGAGSYANYSISKLKKGALLVRLKTRKASIDALRKTGQNKKADKLHKQVFEDNRKVIQSFKKHYSFSDVYFFYSTESDEVRNGNLSGIFLNENTLEVDTDKQIDITQQHYMILDIGPLKIPVSDDSEYQHTSLSRALVMKDKDFEQMYRPFPFYINAMDKSNIHNQVIRLNTKLHSYYKSNVGKY